MDGPEVTHEYANSNSLVNNDLTALKPRNTRRGQGPQPNRYQVTSRGRQIVTAILQAQNLSLATLQKVAA
jgi:hypothetical protein